MGTKKKESIPLIKGQEAEDLVKQYLEEQYRPYSVSDLVLNMHNKVNKATMIKCLDSLVSQNIILSKTYGKMVYYVYKEKEIEAEQTEDTLNMEVINQIKEKLEEATKETRELQQGMFLISLTIRIIINLNRIPENNRTSDKRRGCQSNTGT